MSFFGVVLFVGGICFGYFLVLQPVMSTLLRLAGADLTPMITASSYMSFVLGFLIPFGLVFEIPMVVYFLTSVGIITPDKLCDDFFMFLKSNGIEGVEGNYQYIKWDREYVNEGKKILEPLIAKFKMFVTGGTDSHRKSIFGR